jgi:hypothetical protein
LKNQTHETYIRKVAELAIRLGDLNPTEREQLKAIKLVYGAGPSGTRGVTYYNRWQPNADQTVPFVEVCAFGQESLVQVCGTTIHELGHVLAGHTAGHSKAWVEACARLGLGNIQAAGTEYSWECFEPTLRAKLQALTPPIDGKPQSLAMALAGLPGLPVGPVRFKPCGAGIGTRGGKSRGVGSGSRLRLFQCKCGVKVRIASDTFDAKHNPCKSPFKRQP